MPPEDRLKAADGNNGQKTPGESRPTELRQRIEDDLEQQMEALRHFKLAHRLREEIISGKLGRNSFCSFAAVSELDLIVTDAQAPDPIVAELTAAGPEVVVVG